MPAHDSSGNDMGNVSAPAVSVRDMTFGWQAGEIILDIPRLDIAAGERLFLRGPSGSGKSTLLGLLCGVLSARAGSIRILDRAFDELSEARRDAFRADHFGVIFQMFNLLPYLSARGNVTLPCRFSTRRRARALASGGTLEREAARLGSHLGLAEDALDASVRELSVGQQQRVAVARALIGGPEIVVADEPTSALDADARDSFLDLLIAETAANGSSLLFVSHDAALASHFDRVVDLESLNRARPNGAGGRAAA